MMIEVKINDLIAEKISGEWGKEPIKGEGVYVIRTTNFLNNGKLNLEQVVRREISSKKIEAKKLHPGDVIIEKSGGSPNQPVGRVVYFDEDSNSIYLTNNFTTILRPNKTKVHPLYFHYLLMRNYQLEKVLKFQNKTTGIINLKLEKYLNSKIRIHRDLNEQLKIVEAIKISDQLIEKRKESIDFLEELQKSTFLDFFGDLITVPKHWDSCKLGQYLKVKHGYAFKSEHFRYEGEYLLLTPGNFKESGGYRDRGAKQKYFVGEIPKEFILTKGDLLIAMTEQTSGLLGSSIIIPESGTFLHNQRLGLIEFDEKVFNRLFLFHLFNSERIREVIHRKSTGQKVRHTSPSKIEEIEILLPPIDLQNRYAKIVEQINSIKKSILKSLKETEDLHYSLIQKSFRGELDLKKLNIEQILTKSIDGSNNLENVTPETENKPVKSFEFTDSGVVEEKLTSINYAYPPRESEDEINQLITELDQELNIRSEIPCVADYIKHKIIKDNLKKSFLFEDLWQEIEKFPFVESPTYDMTRNWIFEEIKSNKMTQTFDGRRKKITLKLVK